jgi:NSS family neurotransmitter:Na+ symporter
MLYSFVFEFGQDPSSGPGLVFISIPVVFYKLGTLGTFFALIFFLALGFAGFTSAVSLVEPSVMYWMKKFRASRVKAVTILSGIYFVIGIFAILSYSADYKQVFSLFGLPLFDLFDKLTTNFLIPFGGLLIAIFVGFVVSKDKLENLLIKFIGKKLFAVWYFSLRFVAIPALTFTLLNLVGIISI